MAIILNPSFAISAASAAPVENGSTIPTYDNSGITWLFSTTNNPFCSNSAILKKIKKSGDQIKLRISYQI